MRTRTLSGPKRWPRGGLCGTRSSDLEGSHCAVGTQTLILVPTAQIRGQEAYFLALYLTTL